MSDYRKWDLTIKNGQIFPWPTIGKDAETVPVIERKAYEDLIIKMKEMEDILSKYEKSTKELMAIAEKQKSQIYQLEKSQIKQSNGESITFDEFLRRGIKSPGRS